MREVRRKTFDYLVLKVFILKLRKAVVQQLHYHMILVLEEIISCVLMGT